MSTHQTSSEANKKIRLLEIEPVSDAAGVTQFISRIVRYLPKEDFDVHFAASGKGEAFHLLARGGATSHYVDIDYSFSTMRVRIRGLRELLVQERINVLHAHTVKAGLLAVTAARGTKTKVVFTAHGWRFLQLHNPLRRFAILCIEKYIVAKAAAVTYLTVAELAQGVRLVPKQPEQRVIPLSLDISEYQKISATSFREKYAIPTDAFLVIMVGRKAYQKDPKTFSKAAHIVTRAVPTARFIWVGPEGDTGQVGHEEVIAALQHSDAMLFTSRYEGLPISILEAMAAKLPVVASTVGGVPEIIIDKKTGLLFKSGDAARAAENIIELYNDSTARKQYAERAFDLVEKEYSPIERCAESFAALYKKVYEANH